MYIIDIQKYCLPHILDSMEWLYSHILIGY